MTPARWNSTRDYLLEVFGAQDDQLQTLTPRAVAAGLPDIAVSADVGRLLMLLTAMTGGGRGARLALEVGTLAGYSGIWIARGMAPGGRLITVESEPSHADFAEREFRAAGVSGSVEIRRGAAMRVLPSLAEELDHRRDRFRVPRCGEARVPRLLPDHPPVDRIRWPARCGQCAGKPFVVDRRARGAQCRPRRCR